MPLMPMPMNSDDMTWTSFCTYRGMNAYILTSAALDVKLMALTLYLDIRVAGAGDVSLAALYGNSYSTTSATHSTVRGYHPIGTRLPSGSTTSADTNVMSLNYNLSLRVEAHETRMSVGSTVRGYCCQLVAFSQDGKTSSLRC